MTESVDTPRCAIHGTPKQLHGDGRARCRPCEAESRRARRKRLKANGTTRDAAEGFDVPPLPERLRPVEELVEERTRKFEQLDLAEKARGLITIPVRSEGPLGLVVIGDVHLDDDGCDWPQLRRDIDIINKTENCWATPVGDLHNCWPGRLARLYGQQSTSQFEELQLLEWFVGAVPWLFCVGGNHDVFAGPGDPLQFIVRSYTGIYEWYGVRVALKFPNGREVRVNCRHDFKGHSMWNTAHGVSKAVQMGWRDHLAVCGHTHISGYQVVKDPMSGLISHAIRVGSYKRIDDFRRAKGFDLQDQNFSPSCMCVIDPDADSEIRLVTVFWDVERGAEYLTWLRNRTVQ